MAVQFHELPVSVFPKECRPYIARLNRELRDLFGLEGSLSNPRTTTRSDATVARQSVPTVDISRITPSISAAISGSSTVVGTPNLTLGTVNTAGSTTTAMSVNSAVALFDSTAPTLVGTSAVGVVAFSARRDHSHGFDTSFPATWVATNSYAYGAAAAAGVATTFARSDDVLVYPDTLADASDRSKTLTLADGPNGSQLSHSGTWTTNLLNLFAPTGTVAAIIDPNGFIGAAGFSPVGLLNGGAVLSFNWTATGEIVGVFNGTVAQVTVSTTRGHANTQLFGGKFEANYNSTIGNAREHFGINANGRIANAGGWGDVTGVRGQVQVAGTTTRTNVTCFKALPVSVAGTVTTMRGFNYAPATTILATVTDQVGYDCGAMNKGFNSNIGYRAAGAITTGTTAAYGFQSLVHSVGTTRRSFIGANSFECSANHMIVGTSGMGFVVKDTVDSNYYMISTAGGVVGCSSIGATLPAV